jgi:hypothetical protein
MPIFKSAMTVLGLSSAMATFSTWNNLGETRVTPTDATRALCALIVQERNTSDRVKEDSCVDGR